MPDRKLPVPPVRKKLIIMSFMQTFPITERSLTGISGLILIVDNFLFNVLPEIYVRLSPGVEVFIHQNKKPHEGVFICFESDEAPLLPPVFHHDPLVQDHKDIDLVLVFNVLGEVIINNVILELDKLIL